MASSQFIYVPEDITKRVVCKEQQTNCVCCCTTLNYCPSAPRFDESAAMNHQGLKNFLGGGRVSARERELSSGAAEVERNFSELHEKLQKGHVITFSCVVSLIILWSIACGCLVYLGTQHRVHCIHEKVCNKPDYNEKVCPTTWGWEEDCCYAFCDDVSDAHRLDSISDFGQRNCQPDATINKKIAANQSFRSHCNCREIENKYRTRGEGKTETVCGKVRLYGDFKHLPLSKRTNRMIRQIFKYFSILFACIMIVSCFYAWCRTRRVDAILQEHFHDWRERGIKVEYQPPIPPILRDDPKIPGHLTLMLPLLQVVPAPPSYPVSQNKYEVQDPAPPETAPPEPASPEPAPPSYPASQSIYKAAPDPAPPESAPTEPAPPEPTPPEPAAPSYSASQGTYEAPEAMSK